MEIEARRELMLQDNVREIKRKMNNFLRLGSMSFTMTLTVVVVCKIPQYLQSNVPNNTTVGEKNERSRI